MATRFLSRPVNPDAAIRLFCLPYTGAGSARFFTWARYFPAEIDVCPVQLPGREERLADPPFAEMQRLVYAVAEGVIHALDRPFAIFGHSMGALVGFELARCLRRELGLSPLHLFASGSRAPHMPPADESVHELPDDELLGRVQLMDALTADLLARSEYSELLLPAIRADFTVCGTYAHYDEPPLDCPISALGGTDDPTVSIDHLGAWDTHTARWLLVRLFAGGHLYVNDCPAAIAEVVVHDLMQTCNTP